MGYSLSWFAVRGKSAADALRDLGLRALVRRATGGRGSFVKDRNSAAALPDGWYLVCRWNYQFTNSDLERLSRGGEAVACFVEEHVMVSRATTWKEGQEVWTVTHDAEQGDNHLEVRGAVPPEFAAIRDRLMAKQVAEPRMSAPVQIKKGAGRVTLKFGKCAVDECTTPEDQSVAHTDLSCDHLFDIPVELAAALTGFSHDKPHDHLAFEPLDDGQPSRQKGTLTVFHGLWALAIFLGLILGATFLALRDGWIGALIGAIGGATIGAVAGFVLFSIALAIALMMRRKRGAECSDNNNAP